MGRMKPILPLQGTTKGVLTAAWNATQSSTLLGMVGIFSDFTKEIRG